MGGATNCPETPRQKMIGMMYIVLTALLAMNVSASILEGFTMVEESLKVNTESAEKRNVNLYGKFEDLNSQNPTKIGKWLDKANVVKKKSKDLFEKIEALKLQIIQAGPDGKEGTVDHYIAKDNLDAAGYVCLDVSQGGLGQGKIIKKEIDDYRDYLISLVKHDDAKVAQIKKTFNTEQRKSHTGETANWEVATFEMMPLAAVTTILSKIQSDIRSTEGEVVSFLRSQVDADDFRVNSIQAFVLPNSKYVIQGGKYSAQIVLAASDSTQKPEVYIGGDPNSGTGGTLVEDGLYERPASTIGETKYAGYIKVKSPTSTKIYKFESDFTVGAPSATISADKMNVFYAGIDNEVSVSVPGVASSAVSVTMTGGSLTKNAKGIWIAKPAKVGQECIIKASAKIDGKDLPMGSKNFRVKMLPPPVAYIPYRDNAGTLLKYKGSEKIAKQYLLGVTSLNAELNDADIEAKFVVLGFELNITEAMGTSVEASSGANFTDKQLQYIKKLSKGKKFFISGVRAKGPDNVERKLPPMEVIVN